MRLTRMRSPSPVNSTNARSRARPGLGLNQRGTVTSSGSIRSMSTTCGPRSRSSAPPPRTSTCAPVRRASAMLSGSVITRPIWPSWASRPTFEPGRSSTATAPSRESAATAASALGRASISTPTCSPWRTPSESSPLTTLSMRCFAAARVWPRSSNRKRMPSGARSACSSSSLPSEMRVCGRTRSRRARRGTCVAASPPKSRSAPTARVALPTNDLAMPAPTSVAEAEAVARARADGLERLVVGRELGDALDLLGQLGAVVDVLAPRRPRSAR